MMMFLSLSGSLLGKQEPALDESRQRSNSGRLRSATTCDYRRREGRVKQDTDCK